MKMATNIWGLETIQNDCVVLNVVPVKARCPHPVSEEIPDFFVCPKEVLIK